MSNSSSTVTGTTKRGALARLMRFLSRYGIVVVFVALFIALSTLSPVFLTSRNLINLLAQTAPLAIIACGAAFVIIAGGFDLSVGAIYAAAGLTAGIAAQTLDPLPSLLLGVLVGTVVGFINGVVIESFGVNSFIATLASGMIIRGVLSVITAGFMVNVTNPDFRFFGNHKVFEVPIPVYLFLLVAVIFAIVLAKTRLGSYIYASGGNAEAARVSGVRIERVRIITFTLSGFCAGLAGVVLASKISSAQASTGTGIELTVIAAIVVGGISVSGGEGSIWRAILGVLLVSMIGNGFNILNLDPFYQSIAQGVIILIAVAADSKTGGLIQRAFKRARTARLNRAQPSIASVEN